MDIAWKLASTGVAAAAGMAAGKVAELGWRLVTGSDAPSVDDEAETLVRAVTFAVVSAALVTVAQRWASRESRKWLEPRLVRTAPTVVPSET